MKSVVPDDTPSRIFPPEIEPMDYETAVLRALESLDAGHETTVSLHALAASQQCRAGRFSGARCGMMMERRQRLVDASPAPCFAAFMLIGGEAELAQAFNWGVEQATVSQIGWWGASRNSSRPAAISTACGSAMRWTRRVEAVEQDRLLLLPR